MTSGYPAIQKPMPTAHSSRPSAPMWQKKVRGAMAHRRVSVQLWPHGDGDGDGSGTADAAGITAEAVVGGMPARGKRRTRAAIFGAFVPGILLAMKWA
jgi:hypothetical protein